MSISVRGVCLRVTRCLILELLTVFRLFEPVEKALTAVHMSLGWTLMLG